jgi:hypothetical protein
MQYDYAREDWQFSERKYIEQLIRDGHELYPSLKSKDNLQKMLR